MSKFLRAFLMSVLFVSPVALIGCQDNNLEDAAEEVGDAADDAADNAEDAVD